jgi:hypothetical protein
MKFVSEICPDSQAVRRLYDRSRIRSLGLKYGLKTRELPQLIACNIVGDSNTTLRDSLCRKSSRHLAIFE